MNNATNVFTAVSIIDYKKRIAHDANGNIQSYLRNGNAARLSMDNLTYAYKANTNKLDKVTDAAPDASATEYSKYNDIKRGQADGNYQYDSIENLISDASEGITNIELTVYGKISSITKKDGTKIYYTYDASGNRISKSVSGKETYYVRDAGGNVMSIYAKDASVNNGDLSQTELHLYGSSRLGVFNLKNNVAHPDLNTGRIITFTRRNKFFELSNHLGNVLATVSDKKMGVDANADGVIDYFTADVVSAQDYYPFGMLMPGRKYSVANTDYRYGFNGKELDKEVSGTTTYDFGFRIYNPGLGRFLSVDPLTKNYPELTPYQFGGNTPINTIELDGRLFIFANGFMVNHWLYGRSNTYNSSRGNFQKESLYAPDRGFFTDGPMNNGKAFDKPYWEGVDDIYKRVYHDKNAYYTNGSFTPEATAVARYKEGLKAGEALITKLDAGEIELKTGETIKIVGHSQGAAYAAGIATTLSKNSTYSGLIEFVDYISPHQPGDIPHPIGMLGRQFSTVSDEISSTGLFAKIFGNSKLKKIPGTVWGMLRPDTKKVVGRAVVGGYGGYDGHLIGTWIKDLKKYLVKHKNDTESKN